MRLPGSEDRVAAALAAVAAGRPVVVCDDEDRENEGDLIVAADAATPDVVAFFLRHTSGVLCVGMTGERVDALGLPLMVRAGTDPRSTAFTVSVDARGTTTGISAAERARTVVSLANPYTGPRDFTSPGHVFPLRARPGGVLTRAGHTEAAVDLARLAGRAPAGLLCEIVTEDKSDMLRGEGLRRFAAEHGLPVLTIAELIAYRAVQDPVPSLRRVAEARMPTRHGTFRAVAFVADDGVEHLALLMGDVSGDAVDSPVLTRLHSECLTGDILGSRRCDCGEQLDSALSRLAAGRRGVLVYLRNHEGRGIGLAAKLRAYALQDEGLDTVDANVELGLPVDARDYGVGAQILQQLGVGRVRLLTNNPAKAHALRGHGVEVTERVPLEVLPTPDNIAYLRTKQRRMGHQLHGLGERRPGLFGMTVHGTTAHDVTAAPELRAGWGGDTR